MALGNRPPVNKILPQGIPGAGAGPNPQNFYASGIPGLKDYIGRGGTLDMNSITQFMPNYNGIMGPGGGLKDGFSFNPYEIDYGKLKSYGTLKNLATGTGPTDYYKSNVKLIDQAARGNLDQMREENARGLAGGFSSLATTGGLDSGARERLTRQAGSDRLRAGQNIWRDAGINKAQAAVADNQMRYDALGRLTSLDTSRVNANTQIANNGQLVNLQNKIGDVRNQNLYNMEGWGQIGNIYGSEMAARAMEAAANKENPGLLGMGGFLGTGAGGNQGLLGTGVFGGGRLVDYSHW